MISAGNIFHLLAFIYVMNVVTVMMTINPADLTYLFDVCDIKCADGTSAIITLTIHPIHQIIFCDADGMWVNKNLMGVI